jgi:hypothetical protein
MNQRTKPIMARPVEIPPMRPPTMGPTDALDAVKVTDAVAGIRVESIVEITVTIVSRTRITAVYPMLGVRTGSRSLYLVVYFHNVIVVAHEDGGGE